MPKNKIDMHSNIFCLKMTLPLFLILLCVFSPKEGFANPPYSIFTIPEALKTNAHTVIRQETQEWTFVSLQESHEKRHQIVSVLNLQSNFDGIYVFYDNDIQVKQLSCVVYDEFGNEIKKYKRKDFTDQSAVGDASLYSDSRVKYLDLGHLKPPFTVEYIFERWHKQGFQSYSDWQQNYGIGVENINIIYTLPETMQLNYKAYNMNVEPQITKPKGQQQYEWSIRNLVAQVYEPLSPHPKEILPMLVVCPQNFQIEHYAGSFESWSAFGDFVYRMNENRDVLSPEMVTKVHDLTKNVESDVEKIAVLYDYLQEHTRYVSVQIGIGGWQTYDATYVEQNKYGDCKALSNFMKALLKEVGIKSNLVLTNLGENNWMDIDFPRNMFNHMILYVPSEDMWLECTSKDNPLGYVGKHNANRKVLLLDGKDSRLVHLPDIENNRETHEVQIQLDEEGKARLSGKTYMEGKRHEKWRNITSYFGSEEKIMEYYRQNSALPTFSIEKFEIKVAEDNPQATHSFVFEVPQYASKAGKRIFVPLNKWLVFRNLLPKNEVRTIPVEQQNHYQKTYELTIEIPNNFFIESLPKSQFFESDYGSYTLDIEQKKQIVVLKRHLNIKPFRTAANQYETVRAFYKEITKYEQAQMVLKKKEM